MLQIVTSENLFFWIIHCIKLFSHWKKNTPEYNLPVILPFMNFWAARTFVSNFTLLLNLQSEYNCCMLPFQNYCKGFIGYYSENWYWV